MSADLKETLIRKVQDLGKQFDASARAASLESARNSTDRKLRADATHWVGLADTARAVADEAAQLILAHWPQGAVQESAKVEKAKA